MYVLAVSGVKKSKQYGIGSQAEVLYPEAMSGHATRTRTNSSINVAAAKAEVAAAASRVEELKEAGQFAAVGSLLDGTRTY